MDLTFSAEIPHVFDSALRADERVIPLGVRRIHAVHISRLDPVFQLHHDHVVVFHIHIRIHIFLLQRRPGVLTERIFPVRHGAPFVAVRDLIVNGKTPHAHHFGGRSSGDPLDDVDVMTPLLQEQPGGVPPVRAPTAEVAAAVRHKMTAPDGLDLPDDPGIHQFFHLLRKERITQIVPDHQPAFRAVCRLQNMIAALNGNRHGFFQKDRLARFQTLHRHLLMILVTHHDEHGFHRRIGDQFFRRFIIFRRFVRIFLFRLRQFGRIPVRHRHNLRFVPGQRQKRQSRPQILVRTDNPDFQFFHIFLQIVSFSGCFSKIHCYIA